MSTSNAQSNREPISVATFARNLGLSEVVVYKYCKQGRIFGARKHPLTKKWWIYPPAKLLPKP
ncbi:hypothetical protein [Methylophilus sp. TWE2]|uniref:hypothetical protein n=1 Tax=Methylophilus sp. TWE2 TaxID=1662285 RepID=UPI000670E0AD|nr:hypothetical protein [Methylophilus sp. TWE2]AKR43312.1 hypothetical protein ACJ67_07640 [Methylophilus sp. TWE2]